MDSGTVRNHPQSVALPPTELPRPQDRRQLPPLSHTDTPRPPATLPHFQSSTPGPSFSVAAFTSPSRLYTNISLSRSPFQSPFYSGRTSFGGMASGQRLRAKRPRTDSSPPRVSLIVYLCLVPSPVGVAWERGQRVGLEVPRCTVVAHVVWSVTMETDTKWLLLQS